MIGWIKVAAMATAISAAAIAQADEPKNRRVEQAAMGQARKALAARCGAVRLTAAATVANCLASSKKVQADMQVFVAKLRPARKPRFYADGTCEVDLEVKLAAYLAALRAAVERHKPGGRVTPADIDAKIATVGDRVIRVVGAAAGGPAGADAMTGVPSIWSRYCATEGRLRAQSAAHTDARRKLMRKIRKLKVAKGVTVADLMAADEEIRSGLTYYLARLPIKGGPAFRTDELIVDVTVEVAPGQLAEQLRTLYAAHGAGDRVKPADFDRLAKAAKKPLRATGAGAPPEQMLTGTPGSGRPAAALRRPKWPKTLRASGTAPAQSVRRAEQAARAKLARKVDALRMTSSATVKQFIAAANDKRAAADIRTYLSGAVVTRSQVTEKGEAQVTVETPTDRLWKIICFWHQRR